MILDAQTTGSILTAEKMSDTNIQNKVAQDIKDDKVKVEVIRNNKPATAVPLSMIKDMQFVLDLLTNPSEGSIDIDINIKMKSHKSHGFEKKIHYKGTV